MSTGKTEESLETAPQPPSDKTPPSPAGGERKEEGAPLLIGRRLSPEARGKGARRR
ncbi:hypothetical protein FHS85_003980 [Rhodoligotrophos appendicifer]